MIGLDELTADVLAELGSEVEQLVRPRDIRRWANRGQSRLGIYRPLAADVTWAAGATSLALPADFHHVEAWDVKTGSLPEHTIWGSAALFDPVSGASSSGSARLRYWAVYPDITGGQPSLLPSEGDDALVAFCLYSFFKRLASSRADYRRYATVVSSNGVDISELDAISERHFNDYTEIRDALQQDYSAAAFYG